MLKPLTKKLSLYLKQKLGMLGEPVIVPYRSFGNEKEVILRGRVMEDRGLAQPVEEAHMWKNIGAMLKRYISDNIPAVNVEISFNGELHQVETDENGIYDTRVEMKTPLKRSGAKWMEYDVKLVDKLKADQGEVKARGEILIPDKNPQFGIISDIDDTFMVSYSIKLRKKLKLMLTKNAHTRMPFEGVSEFYQQLYCHGKNPIFFVSSSEWNLYDLLVDFCSFHNIPKGPFLLKPLKSSLLKLITSGGGEHDHKLVKIRKIMQMYPEIKFIMIGDSGQKDPEMYSRIALEFPDRILSIYIRDVTKEKRELEVKKIAEDLNIPTVEMLMVGDTAAAASDAKEKGFIS